MKAILPFFELIICASWTYAQRCKKIKGNGNVVTVERKVGNYEGITEGVFYEVTLVEGEEGNITMTAEDNMLEYTDPELRGSTLTIKSKDHTQLKRFLVEKVFIDIPVDKINAIRLPGSGKVSSSLTLEASNFKVHTSRSRNAELKLKAKRIGVISSGSSTITLDGSAESLDITASGSSNLRALELILDTAEIRPSGSSNIRIVVNRLIDSRCLG
jgi:tRNA threonylcarbamoyladenosine modification (KEOPS) complex  Pcc1 subunit